MKLHTKWKRVYNPIIGVEFFDIGNYGLSFFTIEKLWRCKEYCKGTQRYDGEKWTSWFWTTMMQIRTNTGLVYKMPFCPWMDVVDSSGSKKLSDYYNENSWMTRKRYKK